MSPAPAGDSTWNASRVTSFFEGLTAAATGAAPPAVTPYHPAAALLAAFDPATLKGQGGAPAPAPDVDLRRLLADSVPLPDAKGGAGWSLQVGPRQAALATFATRDELKRALTLNDRPAADPLQRLLDGFVLGPAPDVDALDEEGLKLASQVVGWLTGVPSREPLDLPDLDDIRRRLEFQRLVNPLRRLAGDHFHGYADELAQVRNHLDGPAGPPLVIWGLGGLGKSTLIARAALDLIDGSSPAGPAPIVYLDFDSKALAPERPASLLLEAVRQVSAQLPKGSTAASSAAVMLMHELTEDLTPSTAASTETGSASDYAARLSGELGLERLMSFNGMLNAVLDWAKRPLLVAVDTFEDVQYRSKQTVDLLLTFLGQWQDKVPAVRVVIAGRARLEYRTGPEIILKGLDPESAVHCLIDLGVPADSAGFVYEHVGGSPLSLHLAAEVVRRKSVQALADDIAGDEFTHRLDQAMVAGFLFRRVIDQIHNPQVRKLAHPGLVLRYITPALIREVLAGPCQIDVPDDATAQLLWDDLARETSLVVVEAGAVLRHRPDLRREMIRLLRETRRGQAAAIHLAAVDFFARAHETSHDPRDRAEELYHRLCLEQTPAELDPRWDPLAEQFLRDAVDELPPKGMAYLAAHGGGHSASQGFEAIGAGDDFWRSAEQEVWERKTAQWVRDLIRQERFEEALKALRERRDRSSASPLWLLEARVFKNLGQWREAASVLENALRSWPEHLDPDGRLDVLLFQVRVSERLGDVAKAHAALAAARKLTGPRSTPAQRLDLAGAEARLAPEGPDREAARRRLSANLASLSDRDLSAVPAQARRAAAELVGTDVEAVARVLRLVGAGPSSPAAMDVYQAALPGIQLVMKADGSDASNALALWITSHSLDPDQRNSLTSLLRGEEEVAGRRLASNVAAYAQAQRGELFRELHAALLSAFPTYLALAQFAQHTRFINLREIARDTSLDGSVLYLIEWVEAHGMTDRLIEAAADAVPGNPQLQQLRDRLRGPQPADLMPGAIRLRPPHVDRFVRALVDAFHDAGDFLAMLCYRTDRSVPGAAKKEPFGERLARATVERANTEGWAGPLIAAAREARPGAASLYEFAEDYGLTAARPEDDRRIREALPELDIQSWRSRVGEAEGKVCRIDIAGHQGGTGILIGADTVLTVKHLLDPILRGEAIPAGLTVSFDHKQLNNGQVWNAGLTCRLAADWLVVADPSGPEDKAAKGGLDYVVIRVDGAPGSRPVGWPRCEPSAVPRGWFTGDNVPPAPAPGDPLFALYYAGHGPLRLAFDFRSVIQVHPPSIQYVGLIGAPGAPAFDALLNPVAIHPAAAPSRDARVPIVPVAGSIRMEEVGNAPIKWEPIEGILLHAIFADIGQPRGAGI